MNRAHRVIVRPWLAMKVALGLWLLVRHVVLCLVSHGCATSKRRPPQTTTVLYPGRVLTKLSRLWCEVQVLVCEYRGMETGRSEEWR
jgi:hypothetical protein